MERRLLIVGGVAGGASAAAHARRVDEDADITVVERGPYVSYANCGLPYYLSRDIDKRGRLLLRTPESFTARLRVKVLVDTEALTLDRQAKLVRVRGPRGEESLPYDRLILAQGAKPIRPNLPGVESPHVLKLWTVPDADRVNALIEERRPRTAVVVGGGFVGLEMAEALSRRGLQVTVVELLPTLLASMDAEIGRRVEGELEANGVGVVTGAGVKAIHPMTHTLELLDGRTLPAELVLLSIGARPEIELARAAGLELGPTGALAVDEGLHTSDPDIFAVGDMVEIIHGVSGRRVRVPLAGPASRQGRFAATNALGGHLRYGGALGTSVVKVFGAAAGSTGLSERAAREAGFEVAVAVVHKDHHASYYPGAEELTLRLVYDRRTARILGGSAFGRAGVDKRIDVLATALKGRLSVHDLAELDLAYAPPFSSANDPVNVAAMVAENDMSGYSPLVSVSALEELLRSSRPPFLLDVRSPAEFERGHLTGSTNIPLDELRQSTQTLPRNQRIAVVCRTGHRSHAALRILEQKGFRDIVNVAGGMTSIESDSCLEIEKG